MNEYITIGKFVAPSGLTGELILKHGLGKKTVFKEIEALFVEQRKGSEIPYFIQSSKAKDHEESYIKLEGVETREKAKLLVQKNVWLLKDDFIKLVPNNAPIALLGYLLINEGDKVGEIEEVIEQPHQVLLRINVAGKEALVPLHEETLNKIDHKKKEVHVTLPDGLLGVYLG